jgi:hypothetical protein
MVKPGGMTAPQNSISMVPSRVSEVRRRWRSERPPKESRQKKAAADARTVARVTEFAHLKNTKNFKHGRTAAA